MFAILVASFVVVCCIAAMTLAYIVVRQELLKREQIAEEDAMIAALRPQWVYARRMDIPRDKPTMHTRSTKVRV